MDHDRRNGFDFVVFDLLRSLVDDRSRLAYGEILPDEMHLTCARFSRRAAEHFRSHRIPTIERTMTDKRLGPTGKLSLPTPNAPRHVLIGLSTTSLNDTHSALDGLPAISRPQPSR